MKINSNIQALVANNQLRKNNNSLQKSLERLSSGYKINRSADDAAGMAISQKLATQIRGLDQAENNSSDGISVVQTAEGTLAEVESMLQRMRELSVQAANGTYADEDVDSIQQEIDDLTEEIDRISKDTEFNKRALLDGSVQQRSYTHDSTVEITNFSNTVSCGEYVFTVLSDPRQAVLVGDGASGTGSKITAAEAGTITINSVDVEIEEGDTADAVMNKLKEACDRVNISVFAVDTTNILVDDDGNSLGRIDNINGKEEYAGYEPAEYYFASTRAIVFVSDEYGSSQKISVNCSNNALSNFLGIGDAEAAGKDAVIKLGTQMDTYTVIENGNTYSSLEEATLNEGKDITEDDVTVSHWYDRTGSGFSNSAAVTADGDTISIMDSNGYMMEIRVDVNCCGTQFKDSGYVNETMVALSGTGKEKEINADILDIGTMTIQLGTSTGQSLEIEIQETSSQTLGIDHVNVRTIEGAGKALTIYDSAIASVSDQRAKLGAYQNRLEYAVSNIGTANENITQAYANIMDTDMAEEMTRYTQYTVLSQAGMSMLAQANSKPEEILQLLQQ